MLFTAIYCYLLICTIFTYYFNILKRDISFKIIIYTLYIVLSSIYNYIDKFKHAIFINF